MGKSLNLVGKRYGRLVVLEKIGVRKRKTYWKCVCDCGKECEADTSSLNYGMKRSCGCLRRDAASKVKHGDARKGYEYSNLYKSWSEMKRRCNNPKDMKFNSYGARGIKVCKEWSEDYSVFKDWALKNGYQKGLTIDRVDVNGNYCPENCRWANNKQQSRNKQDTVYVVYQGKKIALIQLCEDLNISYTCVYQRLYKLGWDVEKAVSTPVRLGRNQYS